MTRDTLKARAKHLRSAVADMFKVTVTHSQSLELVAKAENFPTWDAVAATYAQPSSAPTRSIQSVGHSIRVRALRGQAPNMATIFEGHVTAPLEVRRLLDLSDSRGALVLISGATGQGKTTTANVLLNDLVATHQKSRNPVVIMDVGLESESCLNLPLGERLVLVDDLRTARLAFEAVALANAGVKVVATLHGKQGLDRLRVLLKQFGIGEVFLDGLIAQNQILSIDQELIWGDESMQAQANEERLEMILRQHGITDPETIQKATQHPLKALEAVLKMHTR